MGQKKLGSHVNSIELFLSFATLYAGRFAKTGDSVYRCKQLLILANIIPTANDLVGKACFELE